MNKERNSVTQYYVEVGEGTEAYCAWKDYQGLKTLCEHNNTDLEDSEYLTGYNCDSFADTAVDIMSGIWEDYCDTCEDQEREPNWEEYMDICQAAEGMAELQLCRTWQRVTNIHIEEDKDIEQFIRESNSATMSSVLGVPVE
jgi:hypothetical protein